MLVNLAFMQERIVENGRKTTAYAKLDQQRVREALKLANNKKKREAYQTEVETENQVSWDTRLLIKVPFRPKVKTLYIDDGKRISKSEVDKERSTIDVRHRAYRKPWLRRASSNYSGRNSTRRIGVASRMTSLQR